MFQRMHVRLRGAQAGLGAIRLHELIQSAAGNRPAPLPRAKDRTWLSTPFVPDISPQSPEFLIDETVFSRDRTLTAANEQNPVAIAEVF